LTSLNETAILVFSRNANEEANEKKYNNYVSSKQAVEIAGQLIDHTLNQAKATGLPVYTFYTNKQHGGSFGERLANAIEKVFSDGVSNLIIIGGDSPAITANIISRAVHNLQKQNAVIAPTNDGGVYLIGLTKQAYQRNLFIDIPWLTDQVFDALTQYFLLLKTPSIKEVYGDDIDNIPALYNWLQHHSTDFLSVVFNSILSSFKKLHQVLSYCAFIEDAVFTKVSLRGPPQLAV